MKLFRFIAAIGLLLLASAGCDRSTPSTTGSDSTNPSDATNVSLDLPEPTTLEVDESGFDTRFKESRQRILDEVDDPSSEGWVTEVLHTEAKSQLKAVAKILEKGKKAEPLKLKKLVAEDFECGPLLAASLETTFTDSAIRVQRTPADLAKDGESPAGKTYRGPDGLIEAFSKILASLPSVSDVHVKFKIYEIEQTEQGTIQTVQYMTLTGLTGENGFEQNATWRMEWTNEEGHPPRVQSIELMEYEEAIIVAGGRTLFRECTESVLTKDVCYQDAIVRGVSYWINRIDRQIGPNFFGYQGVAVEDVNGDGLDDVYLSQAGGLPNRLFLQNKDGTVTDVAEEAGVNFADTSVGCLIVDLDNDADQDMIVCTYSGSATLLLENDGNAHFKIRETIVGVDYYSATAADYDEDGDLDIYIYAYAPNTRDIELFPVPMPYYDANNGGRNALFRNDGDWKFTDVTEEVGLDVDNRRFTLASSWDDYDNDGDLDLYVANDFGRNNLYRNDGGKFVNAAAEAGVEDHNFGMSIVWGDYNCDGLMDMYIGNMFSAAGNRIVPKELFKPEISTDLRSRFLRFARGNTLFQNLGGGKFREVSFEAGVTLGRWAWGTNFVDVNNDGWEDLVVANGFVTGQSTKDL